MSAPAWFNYATYVANKLAQLQATEPDADWTSESLQAAFTAAGYSNDADGMYRHFVEWGNAENVSPSPWFVTSEYMANKLAQLQHDAPAAGWDMAKVEQAFKDAGLSAWDHYTLYGQAEGISPSSLFDTNAYLAAKLAQLQRDEPDAGWESVDQVVEAFQANGLNPIEHYVLYGVNEALSYTPVAPVEPEKPVTDELTTARDVLNLGAGDHVIGGVASSLSGEKTLNENDLIDGGEGNDTLRVTMNANFNGFTVTDDPDTTGGMKNVENVELINNGSIARTFSAKGIDGATTYTLKAGADGTGAINLKDLSAAGITVNVDGLKSGTTRVEFAAAALDGAEDSLTLGLTNAGTAPDAAVNVSTSSGLESVTIKASGPNYVDLSGVDAPNLAMTGSGALNISAVHARLESFDGSAATGNVTADLRAADEIQALVGTQGDDTFYVENLNAVATLDGGAGNDTLWLDGVDGTLLPTVSGFETIGVKDNAAGLTLFGQNAKDFSAVSLENATVTLANLNTSTFTVTSQGVNGDSNTATLNDAEQLTVNVESTAEEAASQTIATNITATKATDAVINVGANVAAAGAFNFAKTQSVQLNVTGNVVDGVNQTSFGAVLDAANATDLTVTADANVMLGGESNLSKVQSLNIIQNDYAFDAKANGVAFAALNSLNVSGSGKNAAAKFGDLGATTNAYGLTVTAAGLAAGLELGNVATQDDVTLNFANVFGNVTTDTITGNNVSVQVAQLAASSVIGDILATSNVTVDASDNLSDSLKIGNINMKWGGAVSVTVDGAADTLALGSINNFSGKVTLDFSGYLNNVTEDSKIEAFTVNVYGSELAANTFNNIVASTLTFTGGLGNDHVTLANMYFPSVTVTLDTGAGNDTVTISGQRALDTITVSGDMGGDANDTITIDASSSTVSGGGTLEIDISNLGGYATSTITCRDLTFATTIIGGSGDDTIKTGEGAFLISDPGCDTLTGGAGADTFQLTLTESFGSSVFDKATTIITDFDADEDKIIINTFAGYTVATKPSFSTLDEMLGYIKESTGLEKGNVVAAEVEVDSSTYLVVSGNNSGEHTAIIQLQGVDLDDLGTGSMISA